MKKFWERNKRVIALLIIWRIILYVIEILSPGVVPLHVGYNGPTPWANHDGIYYLRLAEFGYFEYSEAFFPFYPLVMNLFSHIIPWNLWLIGSLVSLLSFTAGILFLHNFLYKTNETSAWWTILFIVCFPTSFFFSAVYSTGLFFLLTIMVFLFARKKLWFWCGISGAFASATSIFGVFLFVYAIAEYMSSKPKKILWQDIGSLCLIPLGLISYMIFLYMRNGDPLLFFHMQPMFGANRTGNSIILLPQVIWRYIKILCTAFLKPTPMSYGISVLEFVMTIGGYIVLWWGYKHKERVQYLLYGILAITLPTLTGTFSSMPRYLLNVFPLFLILGRLDNKAIRYTIVGVCVLTQIVLSAMFLRGWFVS